MLLPRLLIVAASRAAPVPREPPSSPPPVMYKREKHCSEVCFSRTQALHFLHHSSCSNFSTEAPFVNPLDRPVCSRSVGEPLAEQHCHRLECRLRCLELASTLRRSGASLAKVTVQAERIHCHRSPLAVRAKLLVSFAHTTWIVAIFLYLSTVARMRVRGHARRLRSSAFFSAWQVRQGSSLVFIIFFFRGASCGRIYPTRAPGTFEA